MQTNLDMLENLFKAVKEQFDKVKAVSASKDKNVMVVEGSKLNGLLTSLSYESTALIKDLTLEMLGGANAQDPLSVLDNLFKTSSKKLD